MTGRTYSTWHTTTGQIFYSRDDGDTWELLIDYLPPINSVDCGTVV